MDEVKGLGFCVSIEHAEFMSYYFNEHGITSMFLTGKSSDEERKAAKGRLVGIDSRRWIRFLLHLLPRLDHVDFAALRQVEQRMLQMFCVTVWGQVAASWSRDEVLDNLYSLYVRA